MTLDHIVIFVRDLEQAVRDYTELGFQVEPGGRHARTENALIIFADGSYIELLALQKNWKRPLIRLATKLGMVERSAKGKTDMYGRLLRWISRGTGIVDWCASTEDMAATLKIWESEQPDLLGYQEFDRTRPDEKIAKWYLGGARRLDLPFLIEDISDRDIRVPPADRDTHPNGALGIEGLTLPVENPGALRALYEKLDLSALPVDFAASGAMTLSINHLRRTTYSLDINKTHGAEIHMLGISEQ